MNRSPRPARPRAFTLVELIVTLVIGSMVATATTLAMSQVLKARESSASRQQARARAEAAASMIAQDAANLVRDKELTFCKLSITSGGAEHAEADDILMLIHSMRPVRGIDGIPEGDVFESQYRLMPEPGKTAMALWRRSDPGFDRVLDGGGVASPLVSGVDSLSIRAYDGNEWFEEWDSDLDGLPHAIRIVVRAESDGGRATAVVRRVIAFDRVPVYTQAEKDIIAEQQAAQDEQNQSSGNSGSGTTGGTNGNGNAGGLIPGGGRPRGGGQGPRGGGSGNGGQPGGGPRGGGGNGGGPGPGPGGGPRGGGGQGGGAPRAPAPGGGGGAGGGGAGGGGGGSGR